MCDLTDLKAEAATRANNVIKLKQHCEQDAGGGTETAKSGWKTHLFAVEPKLFPALLGRDKGEASPNWSTCSAAKNKNKVKSKNSFSSSSSLSKTVFSVSHSHPTGHSLPPSKSHSLHTPSLCPHPLSPPYCCSVAMVI